jgi:phage terminase large subunit-like protein
MLVETTSAADRAVNFINGLTHAKGAQWARKGFNLRPWQESFIRQLFGTLQDDGLRQYRKSLLALPRKNGKSELGAAIALYMLCSEQEEGGEIYSAATDREQASLVFNVAAQMVKNDPTLSRFCTITESRRQIKYAPTNSIYRAIPADAPHAHGYNASALIYDELHAAPNAELWDVLTTSMGARTQPLMLAITTAGYDRESICFKVWEYARQIRDGVFPDPSFLPCIFEAPDDADWRDEETWHKANPALGDFRQIQEMRELAREAQNMPARESVFRRLYLNQWTESAVRWIGSDEWDACQSEFTAADLKGRDCFAGLDLGYRSDFCALVLVFPIANKFHLLPWFWLPKEGNRDLKREPFAGFVRKGLVNLTLGNSTDFDLIRRHFNDLQKQFNIRGIAADPWNARQLSSQLIGDGFEVAEVRQNMQTMNEPAKEFEAAIKTRRLAHDGNDILRWMMANTTIETDTSGNYRPSKKTSTEKIDGIVASIMGIALAMQAPPKKVSVYERRGIISVADDSIDGPVRGVTPAEPPVRRDNWREWN